MNRAETGSAGIDRWTEALTWYARLRAVEEKELIGALGRKWLDWLGDPENRRVFDQVTRLLADRDLYHVERRPTEAELKEDRYDLAIPIAEWRSPRVPHGSRKQRIFGGRWWWLGGIGFAAIAMLIVLWPMRSGPGGGAAPLVYQTAVGDLEEVHLRDGSSITLGGLTKVSVSFSAQRRSVSLIEGQAWFKVAHDPHWPFIVAAGDGTIRAVGTAFTVTRDSDRVVVTVTEGTVEVSAVQNVQFQTHSGRLALSPNSILRPVRLHYGQQVALGDDGLVTSVQRADPRAATAWTRGRLTFDNQPLRYVVETVDRYTNHRIFTSTSAGELRFSGIIRENDIDEWLQGLEKIFPVTVRVGGSAVCVQMQDPAEYRNPICAASPKN